MVQSLNVASSWMALLLAAMCGTAISTASAATEGLDKALRPLCSQLQQSGWAAPADPLDARKRSPAETDIAGVAYLCSLEISLQRDGVGRSPDLDALLISASGDISATFSANVWCEADRSKALTQLSADLARNLSGVSILIPDDVLKAIREGSERTVKASGLIFSTHSMEIDPDACSASSNRRLSAVLMKTSVSIEVGQGD
jgi:hypothetical protein